MFVNEIMNVEITGIDADMVANCKVEFGVMA
jgi:hypothetical protein